MTCCTFQNWDPISLPGIAYPPSTIRGVATEGQGGTTPRAPNHCKGAEKSPKCHKYFLQHSKFASERSQVRTWVRQTCFLPRALANLVTPLTTMPTVLWETLCCCITLRCVVHLGLVMSWPSMFRFGSAILHANIPLKNVSSEFVLFCKKAAPLHFIQAAPRVVLSAIIGNFANKFAYFSRIFSHPVAKIHVPKRCSMREHDATWIRLFLPLFSNSWDWYKTPVKNLNKFFREGPWPLRPHSGCASVYNSYNFKLFRDLVQGPQIFFWLDPKNSSKFSQPKHFVSI